MAEKLGALDSQNLIIPVWLYSRAKKLTCSVIPRLTRNPSNSRGLRVKPAMTVNVFAHWYNIKTQPSTGH